MDEPVKPMFSMEESVFRRDGFKCSKCGEMPPNVLLYTECKNHPNNGGKAEYDNLITVCQNCRRKKDSKVEGIPEDALTLQRQQFLMLMRWEQGKSDNKNDFALKIVQYINNKIRPLQLNKNGKTAIRNVLKNTGVVTVVECINDAFDKYVKYNDKDEIDEESVETFLNAIGKFTYVKKQSPIKQKCYYIRKICKNRFPEYEDYIQRDFMSLMENYITALSYHWTEERILRDLETEVQDNAKTEHSWSNFKQLIQGWINDINAWEKPIDKQNDRHQHVIKDEHYETFAFHDYDEVKGAVEVLKHLYLEIFGKDKEQEWIGIARRVYAGIFCYIYGQRQAFQKEGKVPNGDDSQIRQSILEAISWSDIFYVDPFEGGETPDCSLTFSGIFYISEKLAYSTFEDIVASFNFYQRPLTYESSITMMTADIAQCLKILRELGVADTSYESLSSILRDEMP